MRALPCVALRTLLLGGSGATTDVAAAVVAERYGASLTELSLASAGWRADGVSDVGLRALASCGALRSLDLSGSTVTTDGIRTYLAAARGLRTVKLEHCRGLSRCAIGSLRGTLCRISIALHLSGLRRQGNRRAQCERAVGKHSQQPLGD